VNEDLLRGLAAQVLGVLVRRGNDFASAEDAVQEALIEAHRGWPEKMPDEPKAWLVTVAQRKLVDAQRSEAARRRREQAVALAPGPGPTENADDTLFLMFLCCHPDLSPASAVALTLRAVGGLTTRQVAEAFLVPEPTMAQRISRAKRTVTGSAFSRPADIAVVLRVLYLIFNEGYGGGRVDLAGEAIRLTRILARESDEPEVAGLLALMLLHHARRAARTDAHGALVPLDEQDRDLWQRGEVAEGVHILSAALARDDRGEYQIQAAIAALHDDAATAAETDWPQILAWYDELVALTDNPMAALSRAVAVGEVHGGRAGLAALVGLDEALGASHRLDAVRARLHQHAGQPALAAELYTRAALRTRSTAERDHLSKLAAQLQQRTRGTTETGQGSRQVDGSPAPGVERRR
jgi:RNA polymerase sigma factor (sigma-70 family)